MTEPLPTWHITLDDWHMYHLRRWRVAISSGDITMLNDLMTRAIHRWPYAGDPGDDLGYDDLTAEEWTAAVARVDALVDARLAPGKSGGC